MPIVLKLFKQEPDSHPFRYPVDPYRLDLPVSGRFLFLSNNKRYNSVFVAV